MVFSIIFFFYYVPGRELVAEDAENIKGDYAFDNPAFKGTYIDGVQAMNIG